MNIRKFSGLVLAAALLATPARATDLSDKLRLPQKLADNTLQIGDRRLQLPPGEWVLTVRHEEETVAGGARTASGRGIVAWAALMQDGRLRAVVSLGLPVDDFRGVRRPNGNGCADDDTAIQRLDLSRNFTKPECLAIYGERDLRGYLARRSPHMLAWLEARHLADPGPLVRFVYKLRGDATYGSLALTTLPGPFDSDEVATHWATGLRDALKDFFEHRRTEASLPALPVDPSSPR